MAPSANTIKEVIRRGIMLSPPEAFALWEAALKNDPEGCAEFALDDESGFTELVWMGELGFDQVACKAEFSAAVVVGHAVFTPDVNPPRLFPLQHRGCFAYTRRRNSYSTALPALMDLAVVDSASAGEAPVMLQLWYESFASGGSEVFLDAPPILIRYPSASFLRALASLGLNPRITQVGNQFDEKWRVRNVLIYG